MIPTKGNNINFGLRNNNVPVFQNESYDMSTYPNLQSEILKTAKNELKLFERVKID